jgi:hypothetical protein
VNDPQERISQATKGVERQDAQARPDAGPEPTAEEAEAAERSAPASEETKENYQDYVGKAASQKGEGRIP